MPGAVAKVVLMVKALEPPDVIDDGEKLAVAPAGRPVAERATV